jgi:hypothetical protein
VEEEEEEEEVPQLYLTVSQLLTLPALQLD